MWKVYIVLLIQLYLVNMYIFLEAVFLCHKYTITGEREWGNSYILEEKSKESVKITKPLKKNISCCSKLGVQNFYLFLQEDFDSLLAKFAAQDAAVNAVKEEVVSPPSRRSCFTLTPHPWQDQLILFGGEYFNGSKVSECSESLFNEPPTAPYYEFVINVFTCAIIMRDIDWCNCSCSMTYKLFLFMKNFLLNTSCLKECNSCCW